MDRALLCIAASIGLFVAGCGKKSPDQPSRIDHSSFDSILKTRVRDARVDYLGIRKQDRPALRSYLDAMSMVDTQGLADQERLAYYLNLYNATMIDVLVDRLVAGYSPAVDDYGVFKESLVRLQGRRVSLNELEHEIIRKEFKEPRIHVALVCGATSCPPLLPRAYRAEDLDAVLEAGMRRFLADTQRNQLVPKEKTLRLSRIFDWYKADFGGEEGLVAYVDRYTTLAVAEFSVEFLPYSWELNMHRPGPGWVSLKTRTAGLREGEYLEIVSETPTAVRVRSADGEMHTIPVSEIEK